MVQHQKYRDMINGVYITTVDVQYKIRIQNNK